MYRITLMYALALVENLADVSMINFDQATTDGLLLSTGELLIQKDGEFFLTINDNTYTLYGTFSLTLDGYSVLVDGYNPETEIAFRSDPDRVWAQLMEEEETFNQIEEIDDLPVSKKARTKQGPTIGWAHSRSMDRSKMRRLPHYTRRHN